MSERLRCRASMVVVLFAASLASRGESFGQERSRTGPPAPADVLSEEEWRRVDQAVERALDWLVREQESDGSFPTITMTTIDRLVGDLGLEKVDFIKLDIEGAERNALAGASSTMQNHRPRMAIAAYHEPDDVAVLSRLVRTAQPAYEACVNNGQLGHGYATLMFR